MALIMKLRTRSVAKVVRIESSLSTRDMHLMSQEMLLKKLKHMKARKLLSMIALRANLFSMLQGVEIFKNSLMRARKMAISPSESKKSSTKMLSVWRRARL